MVLIFISIGIGNFVLVILEHMINVWLARGIGVAVTAMACWLLFSLFAKERR